jgi:hypothetical protein
VFPPPPSDLTGQPNGTVDAIAGTKLLPPEGGRFGYRLQAD